MVREAAYDEVFDSQCHFRSILDSMARPGKINDLKRLGFEPPQSLLSATTAVCLSLLNQDVSFYIPHLSFNGWHSHMLDHNNKKQLCLRRIPTEQAYPIY